ncbi:MAG TPA: DUF2935 domain-containing protein, partial [Bacilli bacterium]
MSDEFVARSLDEVRFWSRIMKEHALFLKLGFRCDDKQLIHEAERFFAVFEGIEKQAHSFTANTEPQQITQFNREVYTHVTHIWVFKRKV